MSAGTFEAALLRLGDLLAPLVDLDIDHATAVLADLAVVPGRPLDDPAVVAALANTAGAASDLRTAIEKLQIAIDSGDAVSITQAALQLGSDTGRVIDGVKAVSAAFAEPDLARQLFDYLFVRWLEVAYPVPTIIAIVTGLIDREALTRDVDWNAPRVFRRATHPELLGPLFEDPASTFRAVYADAGGTFSPLRALERIQDALLTAHVPCEWDAASADVKLKTGIAELEASADGSIGVALNVGSSTGIALAQPGRRKGWSISLGTSAWDASSVLRVDATGLASISPPQPGLTFVASLAYSGDGHVPLVAVGGGGLYCLDLVASAGVAPSADGAGPGFTASLDVHSLEVRIPFTDAPAFIATTTGPSMTARVSLHATWSPSRGLRLSSGGASIEIPVNAPVLKAVRIELLSGATSPVELAITAELTTTLGPCSLLIEGAGIEVDLVSRSLDGNLAIFDFAERFIAPSRLAVTLDSSLVSGGGAFGASVTNRDYEGGLTLRTGGIELSAYGVLDPGSDGRPFSLGLLGAAAFPGVPIGLGFVLDRLGALVGIHRGLDTDALRNDLRTGAVTRLIAGASDDLPASVAAFIRYVPYSAGRFTVGALAGIGWGTPRLLQIDACVALELPSPTRIVLVAAGQLGLPDLSHRTADIRIDALGVIDFERDTLAIDASLHDSKLAGYPLTGDMALRLAWGDAPQFLFSVGGFHPHFTPPPGFPTLRRLALTAGDNPQLRMSCYLALTSNTAQVGAQADLTASGGGFDIKAHVGFDALFEFVPFHFEVEITASASISWHGHNLLGVDLDFLLTGPHPWHAKGDATFSILWWDISVGFDHTWGDATPAALPPSPDIAGALRDALGRADAWSGELPAGELAWVAFGSTTADTTTVHPFAALVVRERAVPLDYDITEFGNIPLAGAQRFAIASTVQVGSTPTTATAVSDAFAPGQFTQLTSDQKLAAPSFEAFHSGVRIAHGVSPGSDARAPMDTETIVDDPFAPPPATMSPVVLPSMFASLASAVRPNGRPPVPPRGGPRFRELAYTLASTDDLAITAVGAAIGRGGTTYAGLREALRIGTTRAGTASLQVVPRIQVANANARVVVVGEDERGRNLDFVDTVTGHAMTRAEFVDAIHAGAYPDYLVRNINGVATPVSRPNATTADNLG